MKSYLKRMWSRLARLWRVEACAACGAPSAGFAAAVRGKLFTTDAAGQPHTRFYLGGPRPLCRACLATSAAP